MIVLLFGILNIPAVQEYAKGIIVDQLKEKIGTELGIGKLYFQPFNSIELDSVYLYDQSNERILMADRISAGINLFSLLKGDIVITSAWLKDFEVKLSKDSANAPLNIQYIIDAFETKDDNKPKKPLNLAINALNISNGSVFYDVLDKPVKVDSFDVNHIHISDLTSKLALKSLVSDSINIEVKKLSLAERSGMKINDLVFRLITQEKRSSIKGFKLNLPSSFVELERCELDLTPVNDSLELTDYAQFDIIISPSYISLKDLSAISSKLKNFDETVNFHAHISGSVDNLLVEDLSVDYGDMLHLVSNIEVKDLRDKDKMYILGSIDELTATSKEIESIINNFSTKETRLPQQLNKLGSFSFEGDISGYLKQLTAFGSLESTLGIITTDVLFGLNPRKGIDSYIKGNLYTSGFHIGQIINNKDLDKISLNISVDMENPTYGELKGSARGEIHELDFRNYTYEDIVLDINYNGLYIDGHLNVDDPNGLLQVNGIFDLSDKKNPILNFNARVEDLQLDKLHLVESLRHSYLSFNLDADFNGSNIDDAEGYILIDSIDFIREDKILNIDTFLVEITKNETDRNIKISSDILSGNVDGSYSFSSIVKDIQHTLHLYLPSLINHKSKDEPARSVSNQKINKLTFDFQVNNTESLSSIFKLPVTILSQAKIIGFYNSELNKFNVETYLPSIKIAGMNVKSGYVSIKNPRETIDSKINLLVNGKNNSVNDITLTSHVTEDKINSNLALVNNSQQKAEGEFLVNTSFSKNADNVLTIGVDILPSELLLNNASWKMEESTMQIQDGVVAVNNFRVHNDQGDQQIKINGKYSTKNTSDILKVELQNIDLDYIFQTLAIDALRFGGAATGSLFVSTIENKPYANTRLHVTDFKFNGTELGQLDIFSEFDDETKKVLMDGLILSKENKQTKVDGSIDPVKQELSIHFDADSVDVSFLNKYAEAVFQNIAGRGTGNVHLYGNFSDVTVEGKAFIQDGRLGINFLNTNYRFTDTVYMKKDLIYFNDLSLYDQYNNQAIASGKVSHDFFHDFMYHVDLSANNFLLYNATSLQNSLFYGKVLGSGNGTISGDESVVDIDIRMRTEKDTEVRMNFMDEVVNEYSFITYKSKNQTDTVDTHIADLGSPIQSSSGMDINMNFYIDATPDAIVELVMDPVGGDVLRGSGTGAMQFQWSTKSSPRLFGTYNINRGSYNFTFQRIMERRFMIVDGSNVQFRGDPFEATLDVEAIYKVNASLNDLDKNLAESTGQTTIPVNCVLNLTGQLRHPNIGLDITFPSIDSEVERQVKSLINTEDMINRQVASLLILSKFYTPEYANVEYKTSELAALASATLSNQLTKLIGQIDDRWQLGTNIRFYENDMDKPTEAELLLSSRLLNDRLLINGNFGYRDNMYLNIDQKKAMVTDVDIEYLLNNAGTWRIKAYNHYNEKFYYLGRTGNTQGVGILYKKDFDVVRELFHRPRPRFILPSDTITPVVPDSTRKGSPLSHFIRFSK